MLGKAGLRIGIYRGIHDEGGSDARAKRMNDLQSVVCWRIFEGTE